MECSEYRINPYHTNAIVMVERQGGLYQSKRQKASTLGMKGTKSLGPSLFCLYIGSVFDIVRVIVICRSTWR